MQKDKKLRGGRGQEKVRKILPKMIVLMFILYLCSWVKPIEDVKSDTNQSQVFIFSPCSSLISGHSVSLPCDTGHSSARTRDQPTLVLWFREDEGKPIFRYVCVMWILWSSSTKGHMLSRSYLANQSSSWANIKWYTYSPMECISCYKVSPRKFVYIYYLTRNRKSIQIFWDSLYHCHIHFKPVHEWMSLCT